jgi:hypothetical protein
MGKTFSKRGKFSRKHDSGDPEESVRLSGPNEWVPKRAKGPGRYERQWDRNYRKEGTKLYSDNFRSLSIDMPPEKSFDVL